MIGTGIGDPFLGPDGLVHWTVPAHAVPRLAGARGPVRFAWLTATSTTGEPEVRIVEAPAVREGSPRLFAALPDGSSWWRTSCTDWDPAATVACDSLLLAGPAGEPLGRVSAPLSQWLFPEPASGGTTLLSLEITASAPRRNDRDESPEPSLLRLWRGTPQPLAAFDQPADNGWWHDDYERRMERYPRDGWELEWEAPLPFARPRFVGRLNATLQLATLGDDRGPLVAITHEATDSILAGVYRVDAGDGASARLDPRWEHRFPRARNGLAEDEAGRLALAPPWSIALSSRGELALGNWAINPDCSQDRPSGFLVFDERGELIADLRTDELGRVGGMVFDREDRLRVVLGGLATYSPEGDPLGVAPMTPTAWDDERERLAQRARELTADSPLEEWVELYRLVGSPFHPLEHDPERRRLADRLLVEGWPRIEDRLPDDVWIQLAERICARHPEAAEAALRRFESSWGRRQIEWLQALPRCFEMPPDSAVALARDWLQRRDTTRRQAAERALARWPTPPDLVEDSWAELEAAASAAYAGDLQRLQEKRLQLLDTLASGREPFASRLRAGGAARDAAVSVLFASFERISAEYLAPDDRQTRDALVAAAREWEGEDAQILRAIGGLLLLGHGAIAGSEDGVPSRVDEVLRRVVEPGRPKGDLSLWAAIATSRALQRRQAESPRQPFRPQPPGVAEIGLDPELAATLLAEATAALDRSTEPFPRAAPQSQLEHARWLLLRALGERGREIALAELAALDPDAGDPAVRRRASRRLGEVMGWMAADLDPWSDDAVRLVLERTRRDPSAAWQSAAFLDAVVRSYPADHALHRDARARFRSAIDEAGALATGLEPTRRRGASRRLVLPQMIGHLEHDHETPRATPSPLLDELTVADVEALAGGVEAGFEQWLGLMAVTGPWPAAVPELERMLDGNRSDQAAIVLSHLRHPRALEVLAGGPRFPGVTLPAIARAVRRYGVEGVEALAADVPPAGEDGAPSPQTLAEVAHQDPGLLRRAADRAGGPAAAALARLRGSLDAALARREWPAPATIFVLDAVDGFATSAGPAAGREVESALGRTLAHLDRLPADPREGSRAFLSSFGAASRTLLLRLGAIARDDGHPLRPAVLRMMEAPAEEGIQAARWVMRQADEAR